MPASVATGYLVRRFAPNACVLVYVGIQGRYVDKTRATQIVCITQADAANLSASDEAIKARPADAAATYGGGNLNPLRFNRADFFPNRSDGMHGRLNTATDIQRAKTLGDRKCRLFVAPKKQVEP